MPRKKAMPRVMLLIETSRAYGRGLVEGIARYVSIHGPWSIEFQERGLSDPLPPWLEDWHGDGIVSRTIRRSDIDRLLATGLPVVELAADPALGLPRVYADQKAVGELAAYHFVDRGLAHAAFFATDRVWWVEARGHTFETVARQHGLTCEMFAPKRTRGGRMRIDDQEIAHWVRSLPKPCGVFCASDGCALPLMNVCRKIGVAIPEQIAVLGVDNDSVICAVTQPPLSSISLGADRIGYEAASLLDRMMAGERPPKDGVIVDPEQVVARQSTDILTIADPDIALAIRMIREHACRDLQVSQVAQAAGLSRRALEQRFHRALGRTPKEVILRVQMDRARQLLQQTDIPIEQVARNSGFRSFKYFPRAFRRENGMTPRAYRRAHTTPASQAVSQGHLHA